MDLKLGNKHFVITGGTGGIGEAIISLLYKEGAKISVLYFKNIQKARELAESYNNQNINFIQCDLRKEDEVKKFFKTSTEHFGRIDGLVANAGIWVSDSILTSKMSLKQWENIIQVNLTGVFLCVKEFFLNLENYPEDNASLVLIGSTAGLFGEAGHADYSATKAALMYGLTKTWKNEIVSFAKLGRVNTVAPGWVNTPMAKESLKDDKVVRKILQSIPIQKIATPFDIASLTVFLLSDRVASHLNGETIMVHGGMEGRVLYDIDQTKLDNIDK
ncbi:MAG: SDR family oxidoreductase [Asgard group archaeon]|nr:SDR family oxidoreductase [Asgard group archaeon]